MSKSNFATVAMGALVALVLVVGGAVAQTRGSGARTRMSMSPNPSFSSSLTFTGATAPNTIFSNATAASTTASTPALRIAPINVLDSADAVFGVSGVCGTATIDYQGKWNACNDIVTGSSADFSAGRGINMNNFTDDSGTTGNRTVNKDRGINAFAAAATTITITNNRVIAATSTVLAVLQTNDATAVLKNCVPAAGSFTCTLNAAATGTTKIAWVVIN